MQFLQKGKAPIPFFRKNWATQSGLAFTALLLCLAVVSQFGGAKTAYAASISARSASVTPLTSGGGCATSSNGSITACISVNGAHQIVADGYLHSNCGAGIKIGIYDATRGVLLGPYWFSTNGCGHVGNLDLVDEGHTYWTDFFAYYYGNTDEVSSPIQYG